MKKPTIIVKDLQLSPQENGAGEGISFTLQHGQHLAVTGPGGSGKTMLAKALAKKIHLQGTILFQPENGNKPSPQIAFVPERYTFKNLSGISNFYYQQRFNSFDASDARSVTDELFENVFTDGSSDSPMEIITSCLNKLGIGHLSDAPLIQLSSGEHKRFQLAKAFVNRPDLLILEAPYSGLDAAGRKGLNDLLNKLSQNTQIILIPSNFPLPEFITHVAALENNRLSYFGSKESYDFPNTEILEEDVFKFQPASNVANTISEPVVEMKEVAIRYGKKHVLETINWTIRKGEKWLLKGPNGSGKSSLLNLLTGDHPQAYSNDIYLFGRKRGTGESIWDIKMKTGYVSPELNACFDKWLTLFQAVGSGFFDTIGLYRKLSEEQKQRITYWLDFFHLNQVKEMPLNRLPGSLQRATLLARALVKDPELLILDEPCQGLDWQQRHDLIQLVNNLFDYSPTTLIYVSHDEKEIPFCIQKIFDLSIHKKKDVLKPAVAEAVV